ncbi:MULTISPECIES: DUF1206 domain-containing protein [unclassified Brevundimonas]|jgi:hypothetical protein|uniref:DUF1206 domain-containing protein n=1 Tax=unclassified Brevundimonas TaxID=2622653 RepID=UPI00257BA1F3|nr:MULTISPECIES: DUF1206 domain-containing protein [unclassified Brevundimonas]|tara:strand:- start:13728 stop:14624 length:897 start_codon:yes stop_codon:yes gene_type:complete
MPPMDIRWAEHRTEKLITRVRRLWRRRSDLSTVFEALARFGYGARGFVYLSIGVILMLTAHDLTSQTAGSTGVVEALARQPFGRLWLMALGLGLWAFVLWRVLQSVFDADNEGSDLSALGKRAGQAISGVVYGLLASTVFEVLDEVFANPTREDVAENQEKARALMELPFGQAMLIGVGLVILAVGVGNVVRGFRSDFARDLACSEKICKRVVPLAHIGYVARGLAYFPLAGLVMLAGFRERESAITSFGGALEAVETLPAGPWLLSATALGMMAFGAFAFVEGRFRRIRPPRDLEIT